MIVTHKFKIPYDKGLYLQLKSKQIESGKAWSDIISYGNEYFFKFKKWISKGDLEKMTKNTYDLPAASVQALVAKYDQNRATARELRSKGNLKIKYPWKRKFFFSVPYKQSGLTIEKDKIVLKNSNYSSSLSLADITKSLSKKRVPKKVKNLINTVPKQKEYIEIPNCAKEDISSVSYAEIVYKKGSYWFHYSIEVAEEKSDNPFKPAGIDLGEIHAVSVATEDKALVVSGRAIRSIKQYRAKILAELSKKMSRCKKRSNKWKQYNQAKKRLIAKTNAQLEYLFHKTTKETINFLVDEKVTDLVVGNPSGIEKNTRKDEKKKKKNTRSRRQQLSNWSYGRFKKQLEYKSQLKGINIDFVEESYTSQDCPLCGGRHKASGRNFNCTVHNTVIHRDVNGAQNIARKRFKMEVKLVDVNYQQPLWYRKYLSEDVRKNTKHLLKIKSIA